MQALVEHYSTKGWLQRVEQCVLHMDISSLDFNQVVFSNFVPMASFTNKIFFLVQFIFCNFNDF